MLDMDLDVDLKVETERKSLKPKLCLKSEQSLIELSYLSPCSSQRILVFPSRQVTNKQCKSV